MDLHAGTLMDVKKIKIITIPLWGYWNGCKKNQQLLRDLYAGIIMDVKKPTTIMRPICGYCNGCKKTNIYYETYM
jgi:hypothetical protein